MCFRLGRYYSLPIKPIASTAWKQKILASALILSNKKFYQQWKPILRGFQNLKEPMNYFHDVFSILTLLHQHEDENNLKTQHEKENLNSF